MILNQIKTNGQSLVSSTYGFLCNNGKSIFDDEGKSQAKSSEYIFICQDDLYIASTTPEEILHMLKDKYKINIISKVNMHMILVEEIFVKSRNIWNSCMKNLNMLFNNKLPTDLCTTFEIIKLLIEKGNLNLVHNKNSYQHFNYLSRKRKLDKL